MSPENETQKRSVFLHWIVYNEGKMHFSFRIISPFRCRNTVRFAHFAVFMIKLFVSNYVLFNFRSVLYSTKCETIISLVNYVLKDESLLFRVLFHYSKLYLNSICFISDLNRQSSQMPGIAFLWELLTHYWTLYVEVCKWWECLHFTLNLINLFALSEEQQTRLKFE